MSAMFEIPPDTTLSKQELAKITGVSMSKLQIEWLSTNGWRHHTTRAGEPVVGRLYANLKMAGVDISTVMKTTTWEPDFSGLQ